MESQLLANLQDLSRQAESELDYAKPGRDDGLLPLNSILQQLNDLREQFSDIVPLSEGIAAARTALDEMFLSGEMFTEGLIAQFRAWCSWFNNATRMIEKGASLESCTAFIGTDPAASTAPAPQAVGAAGPGSQDDHAPEKPLTLNLESDADLLREFIHESTEHLQAIEQGALVLESDPKNADTLNTIFRAFHTFKGGAGFLNLDPIQELAHELESLLDRARQGEIVIEGQIATIILAGGDCLRQFTAQIAARLADKSPEPIAVSTRELLKQIRAALNGELQEPAAHPSISQTQNQTSALAAPSGPAQATSAVTTVKVDTVKFDALIDSVGEMVIAQSLVSQNNALRSLRDEQLNRHLSELSRITSDLQRTAMSLRMVPIRPTFQKMQRVVRDLAAKVGKKINLLTEGDETELDRLIVEEIGDPLIHMVRNSVDHGIEMPMVRAQRGKPEVGSLSLRAYHQAGNIVVEIKDDGNGLNRDAILAKACEKGLVGKDERLTDNEIFNLIFAPGFSTAAQVTELSGRGVGMDVVRRNIQKLRGKIEIESQPGQGAIFRIYLPLTLAIIDGLVIGLGNRPYILPALSIVESFRPVPGSIKLIQGEGEVIEIRGRLRRVIRLSEILGVKPNSQDPTQGIAIAVEAVGGIYCLLVDELLGKQEVVIKSIGGLPQKNPCVVGATILGDSRVGLILDVQALTRLEPTNKPINQRAS